MNKYVFTAYGDMRQPLIEKYGNSTLISTDLHKLGHMVAPFLNKFDKMDIKDVLEGQEASLTETESIEGDDFVLEIAKEII